MTVSIPKAVGGWFHSRLSTPELDLETQSETMNKLVISAAPAEIPITNTFIPGLDPKYQRLVEKYESEYWLNWHRNRASSGLGDGISGVTWGSNTGVESFRDWFPFLEENAKGSSQAWLVSRMQAERLGNNSCLNDSSRVLGFINTNAMVYQSEIPKYVGGFLRYEVAGVHRDINGSLNLGEYDLQLRSDTARCLYGFSKAPVSATVAVVSADGQENIATTVVSEKDGWLKLAAYGFTFSEKEIQIKLTQPHSTTLAKFPRASKTLTVKQKSEIKAAVVKSKSNPKLICTGTYLETSAKATALARAKTVCNYAKSLGGSHSYFANAKQTTAVSYDARVIISSK